MPKAAIPPYIAPQRSGVQEYIDTGNFQPAVPRDTNTSCFHSSVQRYSDLRFIHTLIHSHMHACPYPEHEYRHAQVHPVRRYMSTLVHSYSHPAVHGYIGTAACPDPNTSIRRTPVHRYAGTPVHEYTGTFISAYTNYIGTSVPAVHRFRDCASTPRHRLRGSGGS